MCVAALFTGQGKVDLPMTHRFFEDKVLVVSNGVTVRAKFEAFLEWRGGVVAGHRSPRRSSDLVQNQQWWQCTGHQGWTHGSWTDARDARCP
jgi:hypothetical protein